MAIPDFEEVMLPLLEYAKNRGICAINDVEEFLAKKFNLSKEERHQLKPSGRETTFLNRILWTRLYLKKAGLIFDPKKAHYQITSQGKTFLEKKPKKIDTEILMTFSEFKRWKNKIKISIKRTRKRKKIKKFPKTFGVIILIDALGTKGIWKGQDSGEILKKWTRFNKNIQDSVISGLGSNNDVSFASFSDTIVITASSANIERTLRDVSDFLSDHIIESMIIGMPIRGCFSVGEFYKDKQLIIGPAIDEAAAYYTLPQWIGISASPSANIIIEKMYKKDPNSTGFLFQKCDIPLKKSIEQNAWALNWVDISDQYVNDNSKVISGKKYDDTLDIIFENLENYSDVGISMKWRNTLKFYELVNERMNSVS